MVDDDNSPQTPEEEEWDSSIQFLWSGPTEKELDAARKRLKKGEEESQVMGELLLQVLERNVRRREEQLANLTE